MQIIGEARGGGDCHSEVKVEKKWKIGSRGSPPPAEPGSGAEGKPDIPGISVKTSLDVNSFMDKVLLVFVGLGALFAIPLIITALKR